MRVRFPSDPPVYDGGNLLVRFAVEVDGTTLACAISAEALEDHFGAASPLETALLDAFGRGRARIEAVCRQALKESGGAAVVLHSGTFRL
jgi:hypothetical protein